MVTLCRWTVNRQRLLLPGAGAVVHLIGLGFPVKSELVLINQSNEKSDFENLAVQKILGLSSEQGGSVNQPEVKSS